MFFFYFYDFIIYYLQCLRERTRGWLFQTLPGFFFVVAFAIHISQYALYSVAACVLILCRHNIAFVMYNYKYCFAYYFSKLWLFSKPLFFSGLKSTQFFSGFESDVFFRVLNLSFLQVMWFIFRFSN